MSRREQGILAGIFLFALVVRLLYLWGQARNNPLFAHPIMDAWFHHEWARKIAAGEPIADGPFFRAPLYYHLIAVLYYLFGPSIVLARVAGCVLGSLTCYGIAHVGVTLAGFRTGVLAGVIAAVYWPFVYFDAELLSVGLENLLNVALLWLLLYAQRRGSNRAFAAAGLVWGLSAITRPTILALAPVIVAWLWLGLPRPRDRKRLLLRFAVISLGAALAILPVTIRNKVVGGEAVLIASNGGVNFYIGNNPGSDGVSAIVPGTRWNWMGGFKDTHRIAERELGRALSEGEVSAYWYRKAFEWIRSDPRAWALLTLKKFRFFWSPMEMPNNQTILSYVNQSEISALLWIGFPVITPLAVGALALLVGRWRTWFLPMGFGLTCMAVVVVFFCNGRYRLPIAPVLVLLAAAGLAELPARLRARHWKVGSVFAALTVAAVTLQLMQPPDRELYRKRDRKNWNLVLGTHYSRSAPRGERDLEKAEAHWRAAVAIEPAAAVPRLRLAELLARLGRLAEAEEHLAAALQTNPRNPDLHYRYAAVLWRTERLEQAENHLRIVLRLRPVDAEAHESLALVLGATGRKAEAVRHAKHALELDPGRTKARRLLDAARGGQEFQPPSDNPG